MLREVADCVDLRVALDASGPRDYNVEVINQMKHVIKVWRYFSRFLPCSCTLGVVWCVWTAGAANSTLLIQ